MKLLSRAIAIIVCWFGQAVQAAPLYHVTYLPFSFPNGPGPKINNIGQIIGNDANSFPRGFIYSAGQLQYLPGLGGPGSIDTAPKAINNGGQVAGSSAVAGGASHAFLYSNGTMTDLGVVAGYRNSSAMAINAAGDVVGGSSSGDGIHSEAFLYHNGTTTDIGSGVANAINSSGTIVGTSESTRAVRYLSGSVIDLGNFGDSSLTYAVDINDVGQIAGYGYVQLPNSSFVTHPFLYQSGEWHDLGLPAGLPLAIPRSINNAGQIVGDSGGLGVPDRPPFLYSDGTIYNLSTLLDSSGSRVTLEVAYDINDDGVILAEGLVAGFPPGGYEAVLLTPVPEPAGIELMLIVVSCVFFAAPVRKTLGFRYSASHKNR